MTGGWAPTVRWAVTGTSLTLLALACGSSNKSKAAGTDDAGTGEGSATGGTGGMAATGGSSGMPTTGGAAGTPSTGGMAGTGATAGTGGAAGTSGTAGIGGTAPDASVDASLDAGDAGPDAPDGDAGCPPFASIPDGGQSCLPPPTGLVAWWRAESDFTDHVGNTDGTNQGATFVPGIVGQAFDFDGSGAHVEFGDITTFDYTDTEFSIEGWVRMQRFSTQSTPGCSPFYPVFANEAWGWFLTISGDGRSGFGKYRTQAESDGILAACPLALDEWFHLAGVHTTTEVRIYVNGVLQNSKPTLATNIFYRPDDRPYIGFRDCGAITFFHGGQVDELSIYDRALSNAEIASIANAGSAGKCIN